MVRGYKQLWCVHYKYYIRNKILEFVNTHLNLG